MFSLLSRIFIKDHKNYGDPSVRLSYGMLSGAFGIFLNILLFIIKFIAGIISGSVAVTADAFNNLSDAGSSLVTLIGFKLSGRKPDPTHPFGHGRIEYISGLIVSFLILTMGFELGKTSFDKIIHPEEPSFSLVAMFILIVSILVKFYMSFYNNIIGKKIESATMKATATDSISDTVSTFVVLLSMIIFRFTKLNIDAYCGLAVSVFILIAGIKSAIETVGPLLGQPASPELVDKIEEIVMSHPEALGIHDLVVHDYGNGRLMMTLHVEVDSNGNILDLHDAIDNIERELSQELLCEATIHLDPIVTDDPEINTIKQIVGDKIHTFDKRITFHDFRMVKGPTHTNIIFDIVVPYDIKNTEEILKALKDTVAGYMTGYFAVINVDRSYT